MSLNDTVVIQIVGALVGILSIIATRLIDRWLPPLDHHDNHHHEEEKEKDEQLD